MINEIIELFRYEFIQRALIGGGILAIIAPIFGNYLLATKSPHFGDSIGHIALFGVLFASIFGFNVFLMTLFFSVLASIIVKFLKAKVDVQSDATLVVLTVLSLALISIFNKYTNINLDNLFFGSLLNVSRGDLNAIFFISFLILTLFIVFYRDVINSILFGKYAKFNGTKNTIVSYGIIIFLGAFVSISISIYGALLISGIMIIPPLIAREFKMSLKNTFILSSIIGLFGLLSGLTVSFLFNLPAGSSISLVLIGVFILSLFLKY